MSKVIRSYCDCGHLSTLHSMWKMEDGSELTKCFGADTDTYYKTVNKYYLDDGVSMELMNSEVVCPCKGFRSIAKD